MRFTPRCMAFLSWLKILRWGHERCAQKMSRLPQACSDRGHVCSFQGTCSRSQLNWYSLQPEETGRTGTAFISLIRHWGHSGAKVTEVIPGYMTAFFDCICFHNSKEVNYNVLQGGSYELFPITAFHLGRLYGTELVSSLPLPTDIISFFHRSLAGKCGWLCIICSSSSHLMRFLWSACGHAGELWAEAGIMRWIT